MEVFMNQHYEYNDKKKMSDSPKRTPDFFTPNQPIAAPTVGVSELSRKDQEALGPQETPGQIVQQQKQQIQQQRNMQRSLYVTSDDIAGEEKHPLPGQHSQQGQPQGAAQACGAVQQEGFQKEKSALAREESDRQWMQNINAARRKWSKLTEEELVKSGGQAYTLKALVRDRYTISHADAYKQVNDFFQSCIL
ncbi:hypothetical protein CBR65_06095 [Cellvibrio sp. PSBB006]|nr:hypothetical protein CBR65_06095 [Cellvibrio sp. PSBB006]